MIPESVRPHADYPNITVVRHQDGSEINYLHRGNGIMSPGHVWIALAEPAPADRGDGYRVVFFVPFGQTAMPEVIRVDRL